jgi:predicted metal-dependent peptidase
LRLTQFTDSLRGASLRLHTRSWSRPGRLPYLRGQSRTWRKHIVLALDMSGSMEHHHKLLLACARAVARTTRLTLILYSDSIIWAGPAERLPSNMGNIGGGTSIKPVLHKASQISPDLLIIATDAEHESISPFDLPACPVLWALTADSGCAPVRKRDRTIPIFRGKE